MRSVSFKTLVLLISTSLLVAGLWTLNWHDVKGTYFVDRATLLSTEGRIASSSVYTSKRSTKPRKTYYHYLVKYEYSVSGKQLASDEVTFSENYETDPGFAERYVNYYRQGSTVTVYYDEKDPSFSVLEPETIYDSLPFSLFALFMSFCGFTIFGGLQLRKRARKVNRIEWRRRKRILNDA